MIRSCPDRLEFKNECYSTVDQCIYASISFIIFASQGLRSALLIFTLGIVSRIFVIPAHCHPLDFDSYAHRGSQLYFQILPALDLTQPSMPKYPSECTGVKF
jgi:hypothetical protein